MSRLLAIVRLFAISGSVLGADYDPLHTADVQPEQIDLAIKDAKRSREIPIRVYVPVAQR